MSDIEIISLGALKTDWQRARKGVESRGHWEVLVRLDRCISWIEHASAVDERGVEDADSSLVFHWIALSALFSRCQSGQNQSERQALSHFVDLLILKDTHGLLPKYFESEDRSRRIRAIACDEGLSDEWWQSSARPPRPPRNDKSQGKIAQASLRGEWSRVFSNVLRRVYVARCQLVHGGARCNSSLNRDAIEASAQLLRGFLLRAIRIIIDNALDSDWSGVPYPPPRTEMDRRGSLVRARRGRR